MPISEESFKFSYKHQNWHVCSLYPKFSFENVRHAIFSKWPPFFKMAAIASMWYHRMSLSMMQLGKLHDFGGKIYVIHHKESKFCIILCNLHHLNMFFEGFKTIWAIFYCIYVSEISFITRMDLRHYFLNASPPLTYDDLQEFACSLQRPYPEKLSSQTNCNSMTVQYVQLPWQRLPYSFYFMCTKAADKDTWH